MKVLQFTIPVQGDKTIIINEERLPFFYTHLHRHKEIQLTWIIKGEGTLVAGEYMQSFKPGDVYIIGANQPHVFKTGAAYFDKRNKQYVHSISIYFDPKGSLQPLFQLPEMLTVKKLVQASAAGLMVTDGKKEIIQQAIREIQTSKGAGVVTSFLLLLQKLAGIKHLKRLNNTAAAHSISEAEGLRMNDIYQYTLHHYTENISLKKIASVAHLTPQAFCRYFKKHTRKTYITFLNEVRIHEACKKLAGNNFINIGSLAYECGFNNPVTFSRVFRKVMRTSPGSFIKEYNSKTN